MSVWTSDELNKIGAAEELQIASLRRDGTLHKPVIIWVVRAGDGLYVRSYRGERGAWYRAAKEAQEGRIWAGDVEKDVTFAPETSPQVNDRIDAEYRRKYRGSPEYVPPMLTAEVRATTLRLTPR